MFVPILNQTQKSFLKNMQELPQHDKDFISTLPIQKNYIVYPIYNYQGFWYAVKHLLGVISSQKHFEAQDSDVFVITKPKTGTTWMKAITFTLINRKRHPIDSQDHPLLTRTPHSLVPFIDLDLYMDGRIPEKESIPSPRLLSTHMPYVALPDSIKAGSSKCKVVYVSRNPKDSLVSTWHFLAKVGVLDPAACSIEHAFEYFCKGISFYGPFWDHVLEYWKQSLDNPDKVLFLKYEDLKEEPRLHLHRLAEFLNCPFTAEEEEDGTVNRILELTSFDHLKGLKVNVVGKSAIGIGNSAVFRKGEVGDWENYLTPRMSEKIDEIIRIKFSGTGLEF